MVGGGGGGGGGGGEGATSRGYTCLKALFLVGKELVIMLFISVVKFLAHLSR